MLVDFQQTTWGSIPEDTKLGVSDTVKLLKKVFPVIWDFLYWRIIEFVHWFLPCSFVKWTLSLATAVWHKLQKKYLCLVKTMNYVKKYQATYKKVTSEIRKREYDHIISRSINNTKALWKIIKRRIIIKQIKAFV
jgi:hypothetical protein